MKQGIKKFTKETQGGRTSEGKIAGEKFLKQILDILGLKSIDFNFVPTNKDVKLHMKPDFVIKNPNSDNLLLLESKYKQIAGSDWEKIESNFGFHMHYYNAICNCKVKVIVILTGYWRDCQKNLYPTFFDYLKSTYGKDCIFDFSDSIEEIIRFAQFMNVKVDVKLKGQIIAAWAAHKQLPGEE